MEKETHEILDKHFNYFMHQRMIKKMTQYEQLMKNKRGVLEVFLQSNSRKLTILKMSIRKRAVR